MSPASRILTTGGNVTIASGTFGQTRQINTANAGIITSNQAGNSGNITLFALGEVTTIQHQLGFHHNGYNYVRLNGLRSPTTYVEWH